MKKILLILTFLMGLSAYCQSDLKVRSIETTVADATEMNAIPASKLTNGTRIYRADTKTIWIYDVSTWVDSGVGAAGVTGGTSLTNAQIVAAVLAEEPDVDFDATDDVTINTNSLNQDIDIAIVDSATRGTTGADIEFDISTIPSNTDAFVEDVRFERLGNEVTIVLERNGMQDKTATFTDMLGIGTGVQLESVVAGTNVTIDNTDPENPIINSTATGLGDFLSNGTVPMTGPINMNGQNISSGNLIQATNLTGNLSTNLISLSPSGSVNFEDGVTSLGGSLLPISPRTIIGASEDSVNESVLNFNTGGATQSLIATATDLTYNGQSLLADDPVNNIVSSGFELVTTTGFTYNVSSGNLLWTQSGNTVTFSLSLSGITTTGSPSGALLIPIDMMPQPLLNEFFFNTSVRDLGIDFYSVNARASIGTIFNGSNYQIAFSFQTSLDDDNTSVAGAQIISNGTIQVSGSYITD